MVKNSQGTATLSKHPAVTDLEEGPVGPAPPPPNLDKKEENHRRKKASWVSKTKPCPPPPPLSSRPGSATGQVPFLKGGHLMCSTVLLLPLFVISSHEVYNMCHISSRSPKIVSVIVTFQPLPLLMIPYLKQIKIFLSFHWTC